MQSDREVSGAAAFGCEQIVAGNGAEARGRARNEYKGTHRFIGAGRFELGRGNARGARSITGFDFPTVDGAIELVIDNVVEVGSTATFRGDNQNAVGRGIANDLEFIAT